MKRKAYRVTVRRMVTGCDYHKTLFLKDEANAFERACIYVPRSERNWLRLVSCVALSDAETAEAREALRVHSGVSFA